MNSKDYMDAALRTHIEDYTPTEARFGGGVPQLLHGAIGLATEAGELLDAAKRHLIYGKPLDRPNLLEEVGDALWYLAITLDAIGGTFEEAMETNITKLRLRYPNKFNEKDALNRDLEAERKALEG